MKTMDEVKSELLLIKEFKIEYETLRAKILEFCKRLGDTKEIGAYPYTMQNRIGKEFNALDHVEKELKDLYIKKALNSAM